MNARRNIKNWSAGLVSVGLMLLLILVFAVSCSDSGVAGDGDGLDGDYAGYEPVTGPGGEYIECFADEDCWNAGLPGSARCIDWEGFKVCALPTDGTCEEICNPLCCYCQGEDCVCTGCNGDEDGDIEKQDGPVPNFPSTVDMGAVVLGGTSTKEFEICNDGAERLQLIGTPLINPAPTPDGNSGDVSEFSLAGDVPTASSKIELDYGDCATIEVTYRPENPGRDYVDLFFSSNADAGFIKVSIVSQTKGVQKLVVTCDTEIEKEDGSKCCLAPSTLVKEMGVLELTLKNVPTEEDSNATLVINEITLKEFDAIFDIDRASINYGKGGELWIAPGQQDKINIIFQPDDPTVYYNTVLVPHNDPTKTEDEGENPFPVQICGGGSSPYMVLTPCPIDFGVVAVGTSQTINVTLSNRGSAPSTVQFASLSPESDLEVLSVNLDPDNDLQPNVPTTLQPFSETQIALTCTPADRKSSLGILQVETEFNPGNDVLTCAVACTGITADMYVWPSSVDFGQVRVGTCPEKTVNIQNNGQADLKIETIRVCKNATGICIPSQEFAIASYINLPLTVPALGTAEIDVEYCPANTGADQAYLQIIPEEGGGNPWTVPLTGNGVEPAICLSEPVLTWTDVQMPADNVPANELDGWRECKEMTVTNCGTMALDIGEIRVPSQVTSEFTLENHENHPNQLAPGGSFTFKVCYLPDSIGNDNGLVVVCTNAANASDSDVNCTIDGMIGHEIPLMANAISPRLDVSPISCDVNFGKVQVDGEQSQRTIILRNIGKGNMQISDISLLTDMPQLGFTIVDISPDPSTWNDGVYTLTDKQTTDYITINIKYDPEIPGYNQNFLIVSHSDKNAACLGQQPGAQYPDMFIKLYGTSETNIPPIAVAKSPAGVPAGQFGSLSRTISVGEVITLDGSASYDPDDDPGTPGFLEDAVTAYLWSSPNEGAFTWVGAKNTAITQARFDTPGQYTIKLNVWDTRDTVSVETPISKLTIFVRQAPIADLGICGTGENSIDIEIPRTLCFDGSGSYDDAGPISGYTWYVQERWPTGNKIRYDGTSQLSYNFLNAGEHRVFLVVTDKDGVPSSTVENAPYVHISAVANETLRIEMSWLGGGDVNLHYVKPAGQYKSPLHDCWANNPGPLSWQSCGYPRMVQSSSTGANGEIEEIDHSQGGVLCNTDISGGVGSPYRLVVQYLQALQSCRVETKYYLNDCTRCGCSGFLCDFLNCGLWCDCKDCTSSQTVCTNIPANITIKMFVNGTSYPKFMKNFQMTDDEVHSGGTQTQEFTLQRYSGQWQNPF